MKLSELLKNELIIPEIQRDYVWGNNEIVLRSFLKNIFNNKDNELDIGFFYAYKVYQNEKIYALIDGQQRITTLVLLYWYLGIGLDYIKKFKFKVRENCNNFLEKLLEENISNIEEKKDKKIKENISEKIKNCIWYLSIWDNDPTVKSMLKALDIIKDEFNEITENKENIKSNIEQNIIFTCITNNDRGLEKEYISLNARGRELEKYEKLKAILVEDMENDKKKYEYLEKWEKDWQDILWECKGDNVYNTDNIWNAVLYWARDIFVIENNICKPNIEKENNKSKKEEIDFDFDLISIKDEYKNDLLTIFDWIIPALKIINKKENKDLFQEKCQFDDENKVIYIDTIIAGGKEESYKLEFKEKALFYGLLYLVKSKYNIENVENINSIKDEYLTINENDEILEKTRIFRNLIQNSDINSNNLKNAVESLKLLAEKTIDNNFNELLSNKEIKGIDHEQKYEEALKLKIFTRYPKHKDTILNIENNVLFKGRIKNIFLLYYYKYKNIDIEKLFDEYDIYNYNSFYKNNYGYFYSIIENKENIDMIENIKELYYIYKKIHEEKLLWTLRWELLLYKFYLLYGNRILLYDYDRKDMYAILLLTYLLSINENDINKFNKMQNSKVQYMLKDNPNIDDLNIKEKLYLIYAMDKKIMEMFDNDRQFRIEYQNNNIVFCSFNKIKGKNDHRMEFNEELKDRLKKFINDEYNIQL